MLETPSRHVLLLNALARKIVYTAVSAMRIKATFKASSTDISFNHSKVPSHSH